MIFQWDDHKNAKNLRKHGIAFEDAIYVFADPLSVTRTDVFEGEARQQIIGLVDGLSLVLVVYTMRDETGEMVTRIISARKATTQERRQYENGTWFS